ncbi:MAG: MmcQ/YjbR family DNA-binding protein [Actinomycetales bacterium]
MDGAALRRTCLSMPGSFEDFPFGPETSVFKVTAPVSGGFPHESKVFAIAALDAEALSVSLKCEPALALQLRSVHPEITGAYHMNKKHWNSVLCTGSVEDSMIRDLIEDSWDLVVATLSPRQRTALGWADRVRSEAAE